MPADQLSLLLLDACGILAVPYVLCERGPRWRRLLGWPYALLFLAFLASLVRV